MNERQGLNFEPVGLSHRSLIQRYVGPYGEGSCQNSFPAMICLREKYGDSVCEKDGWLFTLRAGRERKGYSTYLLPMGGGDLRDAVETLTADAASRGGRICFETVTADGKARLEEAYPGRFASEENRDMAEYIYERDRLTALSGHGLITKRYEARTFWKNHAERARISPITEDDIREILVFQEEWLRSKSGNPAWISLAGENEAIRCALANYTAMGLTGLVLRVDERVRGYVYGCRITDGYLDMMAEKADRTILGIYSALNQAFADQCGRECRYVNWEEDVAVPGLRQAKLSYKPDLLLKKFTMTEVECGE